MRAFRMIVVALLLLPALIVGTQPASAAPTTKLIGTTSAWRSGTGFDISAAKAEEAWQGRRNAIVNVFTPWWLNVDVDLAPHTGRLYEIWNNGDIPMITWEPLIHDPNASVGPTLTPTSIDSEIADGKFDNYIRSYGTSLKTFLTNRRAYLRLGHEANGNWYPWDPACPPNQPAECKNGGSPDSGYSDDTTAQQYKNMWVHVHDLLTKPALQGGLGIDNLHLAWVFNVSHQDQRQSPNDPLITAEALYPGPAYVDWATLDGYGNQSQSPSTVLNGMTDRLAALGGKPVGIAEYGADGTVDKSTWFTDFFTWVQTKNRIRMVVVFNSDNLGAFDTSSGPDPCGPLAPASSHCYNSYKTQIQASYLIGSTGTGTYLTNAQFLGQ